MRKIVIRQSEQFPHGHTHCVVQLIRVLETPLYHVRNVDCDTKTAWHLRTFNDLEIAWTQFDLAVTAMSLDYLQLYKRESGL